MTIVGLPEPVFRFGTFVLVLLVMTGLETWLPRRARRHSRTERWTTNFGVLAADYAAVAIVTFVVPVTAALTALFAESAGIGLFALTDWPFWVEVLLAILVLDFLIWFQHWLTHKVPLLWRLHRVHHADHDIDASTAVRFHPLEILFSIALKSVAVLLLGAPFIAVVVFEALVNATAIFNHANLRLPRWLDRTIRLVLVTPDMHRVHHSVHRDETDSNFGFALPWWDHLFGTYRAEPRDGHDKMVTGLSEYQSEGPERLGWSLLLPFRRR
jgi:sterol desaturase/sphingolipid hydroxylase (fatty acid hydroxylase superfamily)